MSFIKNYAKGRTPRGVINGLETRFAQYLEEKKQEGAIIWWAYEPIRLHLGKNSTYTPDFLVMAKDLELQVFESKGKWIEPGRTKIKIAAEMYPFRFFGAMWDSKKKKWKIEEF
jgi:hypothetical protein